MATKKAKPKKQPTRSNRTTKTRETAILSPDKAAITQMVRQEQLKRERACNDELQALLKKYQCALMCKTTIIGGQVSQVVAIAAE